MNTIIQDIALVIIPTAITWFLARRKNNADVKTTEIENEVKAAEFYKLLLDDAMKRLEVAITTINSQDKRIQLLLVEVENLTEELKKYKQLNGKISERNQIVTNGNKVIEK